jgi:hypothetical protein
LENPARCKKGSWKLGSDRLYLTMMLGSTYFAKSAICADLPFAEMKLQANILALSACTQPVAPCYSFGSNFT